MKRIICLLLVFVMLTSLCACGKSQKKLFSDYKKKINEIMADSPVAKGLGLLVDEDVASDKIKKIEPASVKPDGITTLCYETLSKDQKRIYTYFLAASRSMPEGWIDCGKETDDTQMDVAAAYRAMLCDNPQCFWMPITYFIAVNDKKLIVAFKLDDGEIENDYAVSRSARDRMSAELDEAVNSVVAEASVYSDDFDRELFVHDYICGNSSYDLNGGKMIYSSYGALVDRVCVCEGYSKAMQLIMQKLGIKCGLIYGEYNKTGHMWNYINIGGEWYHLDITWDKSDKYGALHSYFNLTDSEVLESHVISADFDHQTGVLDGENFNILSFDCSSEEYNYFTHTGKILTDDISGDAKIILSSYYEGKNFCECRNRITGDESELLNNVASRLYPTVSLKSYSKFSDFIIVIF